LHSKLNLYLIAKKTVNNFILSIRNVLINYKSKKDSIIRKDYVTKTLIKYCKNIKKDKYHWLKYEEFKYLEEKLIKENNQNMEIDAVNDLIKTINNLELNEDDNYQNNDDKIDLEDNKDINSDISNEFEIKENLNSNEIIPEGTTSLFVKLLEDNRFIKYKYLI
jgi:hypothetical protein